MGQCEAELCIHWTGQGCACEFLGLAPNVWCERCERGHTDGCPWEDS